MCLYHDMWSVQVLVEILVVSCVTISKVVIVTIQIWNRVQLSYGRNPRGKLCDNK
jgi:hypothetical protein